MLFDLEHDGTRYFCLPPVVTGFWEFTFMRVRDDVPQAELAKLFYRYIHEDDHFVNSLFQGETQLGRTLVREEAIRENDHTEILDWERASHLVRSASAVAVSQCVCRHMAGHLGNACDRPQRCCLSLNYAAESLSRLGTAEEISTVEALDILQQCKEAGLAQIGDNVKRKMTYICNCCGCCCLMMGAIRDFNIRNAIVTSNWIVQIDLSKCTGCGECAKACPVEAIEITQNGQAGEKRKWAVCDETLCLGCGVCYSACKFGGVTLKPRQRRVLTPEDVFDRVALMAIERGKLADVLFDDPEKLSHRALGRLVGLLERSPVFKAAMAVSPLRSAFLRGIVGGAKMSSRNLRRVLG